MARLKVEHLEELRTLHDQAQALVDGLASVDQPYATIAGQVKVVLANALSAQDLRGMRMAARDIRGLLDAVTPAQRQTILLHVRTTTGQELEAEQQKDEAAVARIVARGKIRNDNEYYLLRAHLDHIDGEVGTDEKVRIVSRLLDSYRG